MKRRSRQPSPPSITANIVSGVVGGVAGARQAKQQVEQLRREQVEAQHRQAHQLVAQQHRHLVARSLGDFLALTPSEFEDAVGVVLSRHGYGLHRVGGSGDLSADLIGTDQHGRPVVVQCKRQGPGHRIGSPDIQKFIGMALVEHRAAYGIFVTTSEFTSPAQELGGKHSDRLWLIDGPALLDLVRWAPPPSYQSQIVHDGRRFAVGATPTCYAIWDKAAPASPVATWPLTPEGWEAALAQWKSWDVVS